MSTKPTPQELDQAKQIYNDANDFLEHLVGIIQTQVQEFSQDSEDSEDSDYEELSPSVSKFLSDYKEYISSLPHVHQQLVNNQNSSSTTSSKSLRKRFWRYSHLQLLPPDLLGNLQKLCEAKLDRDVQASPSFSTSLPTLDNINGNNEKLLTNDASPSVTLLKAQLEKHTTKEQEKNRIVIRMPNYTFDEPIEEKKVVFVVKKSTAVIVAPPTVVEPPKEQEPINEKSEVVEVSEKVLSEKKIKKNAIDFEFLSKFLSTTKFGFSRSQLSTLVWA